MIKISTFDDWIDYFRQWQQDIGYDSNLLGDYKKNPVDVGSQNVDIVLDQVAQQ